MLAEKLQLQPGVVSPFGLLNNLEKDVKVYVDRALLQEDIITFHPNENDATVFLTISDLFRFFEKLDYPYDLIEM